MSEAPNIFRQVPVLRRYLEAVRDKHRHIDGRGVMQVVRQIELPIDEAFVGMRVRIDRGSGRSKELSLSDADDDESQQDGLPADLEFGAAVGPHRGTEPSTINADLLLRHGARWFILGDPGSGKTTLLRRMAFHAADGALKANDQPGSLPLFVPLRYLSAELDRQAATPDTNAIVEFLCGPGLDDVIEVTADERQAWRTALKQALASGHAILLCDGLDEQRDSQVRHAGGQALDKLLADAPRLPCLVSSRIVGFDAGSLRSSFEVAHLEPFDERQTEEFFKKWMLAVERADDIGDDAVVTGRAQRRTQQLMQQMRANPGVLALASNPLMCAIVGLIYRQGAVLPEFRGELYKLCVDTFVFNWEINKRRAGDGVVHLRADETQAVLEAIALDFQLNPRGNAATLDELLNFAVTYAEREFGLAADDARQRAGALLDLIVNVAGLLIERAPGRFGFFHLTLQEYLAGRAITRRRSETAVHLARHWLDPRWREVLRLAAAHQGGKGREEGEEFIELLLSMNHPHDAVMHYSLRLGIECAGELRVGPRLADRLLLRWDEAWRRQPALRAALQTSLSAAQGRVEASGETLRQLAAAWFHGDPMSKVQACEVVTALVDSRLLDSLMAALRDEGVSVRHAAAKALGALSDARALDALLAAMRDKDQGVREEAARALGALADPRALDALLAALRDEGGGVRHAAAQALGKLADPCALDALLAALRDDDRRVRQAAAQALSDASWAAMLSATQTEDLWRLIADAKSGNAAARVVEAIDRREFMAANP